MPLGDNNPYSKKVKPAGISDPFSWAGKVGVQPPDAGDGPIQLTRWKQSPTVTAPLKTYVGDPSDAADERLRFEKDKKGR